VNNLPIEAAFVSAPPGCSHADSVVTCTQDILYAGTSTQFDITVLIDPQASGAITDSVYVSASVATGPNQASLTTQVVPSLAVEGQWSDPSTTTSPCGEVFRGEFGNQAVTLALEDLPSHNQVSLSFDLYLLRSWNGDASPSDPPLELETGEPPFGPDLWQLQAGGQTLLYTTFSNWTDPLTRQSFPDAYLEDTSPAQTGARQVNSLCYRYAALPMDATYHFQFDFAHTAENLIIDFSALGLQDLLNESWGLDNVRVLLTAGEWPLVKIYLPFASK